MTLRKRSHRLQRSGRGRTGGERQLPVGTLALPTARPWPEVRLEAELLQYKPHAHERAALAQGGSTRGCQGPGAKPAAPHTRGSASGSRLAPSSAVPTAKPQEWIIPTERYSPYWALRPRFYT